MSSEEKLAAKVSTKASDVASDIGSFIRSQRETAHVSMRQLAERSGVSNPYLSQVERGLRKPSADVLSQIAKALRVSAEVLYVRAGILEPSETSQVRDAIHHRYGDHRASEADSARYLTRHLPTRTKPPGRSVRAIRHRPMTSRWPAVLRTGWRVIKPEGQSSG
ncbi:transcriptional regulatory protein [Mycobacterium tuberculosis RGTB327]|nr:transcriptional regulatory protein [Mycobacterium tuberculosis RGTB327]